MAPTYTDQFYLMDPAYPPPEGTYLSVVHLTLTDQNGDYDIDAFDDDMVDGVDVTHSWPGDVVVVDVPGVGPITYTGTTFYLADGQRMFTPTDGQVLQDGKYLKASYVVVEGPLHVKELGPPCFTAGTLIAVPGGMRRIEDLAVGDLVETMDHGPQPVRWIGRRKVDGTGVFAPVRFEQDVLGNSRELLVSPQHRMLVSGWRAELHFGEPEMLAAAAHLLEMPGVSSAPMAEVEYVHVLFDRHEIVFAEGAPSESFHPGSWMLDNDRLLLAEILAIFPELAARPRSERQRPVRPVVTAREARLLVA